MAAYRWTFDLSGAEYRHAASAVLQNAVSPAVERFARLVIWGGAIALLIIVSLAGSRAGGQRFGPSLLWVIPAFALAGLFELRFLGLGILARRARYPLASEFWANEVEVGQSFSGRPFTSKWGAVEKVVETKDMFLFYVASRAAYCLPKRVVDPGDLRPLRKLVRDRLMILDRRRGTSVYPDDGGP